MYSRDRSSCQGHQFQPVHVCDNVLSNQPHKTPVICGGNPFCWNQKHCDATSAAAAPLLPPPSPNTTAAATTTTTTINATYTTTTTTTTTTKFSLRHYNERNVVLLKIFSIDTT
jgi:hypothetical protein